MYTIFSTLSLTHWMRTVSKRRKKDKGKKKKKKRGGGGVVDHAVSMSFCLSVLLE